MEGACLIADQGPGLVVAGCVSNPEVKSEADAARGGAPSAAGAGLETGTAAPEFDFIKAKNLSARLRSASGASKFTEPFGTYRRR